MVKKYVVRLTKDEREKCQQIIAARTITHCSATPSTHHPLLVNRIGRRRRPCHSSQR